MIELLKVHWEFIRRPSECLDKYIRHWPEQFGLVVYAFFAFGSSKYDVQIINSMVDLSSRMFPESGVVGYYFYSAFVTALHMIFLWYVIPFVLKKFLAKKVENVDVSIYRKLIFYSPTAVIILNVIFIIPLSLLGLILGGQGIDMGANLIFLGIIVLVKSLFSMWALVAIIMSFIIVWKGLAHFYGLKTWQILVVQFLLPMIVYLPLTIAIFPDAWQYIQDYISIR